MPETRYQALAGGGLEAGAMSVRGGVRLAAEAAGCEVAGAADAGMDRPLTDEPPEDGARPTRAAAGAALGSFEVAAVLATVGWVGVPMRTGADAFSATVARAETGSATIV